MARARSRVLATLVGDQAHKAERNGLRSSGGPRGPHEHWPSGNGSRLPGEAGGDPQGRDGLDLHAADLGARGP
jgi:hypothetical protein